jgi:hypothetical protein
MAALRVLGVDCGGGGADCGDGSCGRGRAVGRRQNRAPVWECGRLHYTLKEQ